MSYPDGRTIEAYVDAAGQLAYQDDWRGSSSGRTTCTDDGPTPTTDLRPCPVTALTERRGQAMVR
jgi:hypothetical protein